MQYTSHSHCWQSDTLKIHLNWLLMSHNCPLLQWRDWIQYNMLCCGAKDNSCNMVAPLRYPSMWLEKGNVQEREIYLFHTSNYQVAKKLATDSNGNESLCRWCHICIYSSTSLSYLTKDIRQHVKSTTEHTEQQTSSTSSNTLNPFSWKNKPMERKKKQNKKNHTITNSRP